MEVKIQLIFLNLIGALEFMLYPRPPGVWMNPDCSSMC